MEIQLRPGNLPRKKVEALTASADVTIQALAAEVLQRREEVLDLRGHWKKPADYKTKPQPAMDQQTALRILQGCEVFTLRGLAKLAKLSTWTAQQWIRAWEDLGYCERVPAKLGFTTYAYMMTGEGVDE
jgi:hypothetical protein